MTRLSWRIVARGGIVQKSATSLMPANIGGGRSSHARINCDPERLGRVRLDEKRNVR